MVTLCRGCRTVSWLFMTASFIWSGCSSSDNSNRDATVDSPIHTSDSSDGIAPVPDVLPLVDGSKPVDATIAVDVPVGRDGAGDYRDSAIDGTAGALEASTTTTDVAEGGVPDAKVADGSGTSVDGASSSYDGQVPPDADSSTGIEGANVHLVVQNPLNRAISQTLFANIGPGIEFPRIEQQALTGFTVGPADVDVSSTSITFLYHPAAAFAFGTSTFNGYVLDFESDGDASTLPPIKGVAIGPETTNDLVAARLSFEAAKVRINVSGLNIGPNSKLVVALLFTSPTDLATPFAGTWVGTVNQGAKTFTFGMNLVQRGSDVNGSSRIESGTTFAVMSVSGTTTAKTLTYSETSIVEQDVTAGSFWCLKTGTLTLTAGPPDTIEGSWTAAGCNPGTITVSRQ